MLPDTTVGEGLAIAGTTAQNDSDATQQSVEDWLQGLGY